MVSHVKEGKAMEGKSVILLVLGKEIFYQRETNKA